MSRTNAGAREAVSRARNWDFYTAAVATVIGLLALLVSGYTAYVQRQQLRAQVWPYLTIGTSNAPPEVGVHVINSGTGPARIVAVRVTVDGHVVATWWDAQKVVGDEDRGIRSHIGNTVLPAGKDLTVFRPRDEASTSRFIGGLLGAMHELQVAVCYCSVLDECWVATSGAVPVSVSDPEACPIAATERFKE